MNNNTATDRRKQTLIDKVINIICVLILFQLVCWMFVIYLNQTKLTETQLMIATTIEQIQHSNIDNCKSVLSHMTRQSVDIDEIKESISEIKNKI